MKQIEKAVDFKQLEISSPSFKTNQLIPSKYTCDGVDVSPPIDIKGIPEETKCLAIIMEDPDAPIRTWVHWVAWNIPVTQHIKAGEIHGIEGVNDFLENRYDGPCPPSGEHRYYFKIYALDDLLDLPHKTTKLQLEKAMSDHIIGFGELVAIYSKRNNK